MSSILAGAVEGLAEDLERAIADGTPSWLPGFSPRLAAARWVALRRTSCITPRDYGTGRVRASSPCGPRDIQAELVLPTAFGRAGTLLVETLQSGPASRYVDLGLEFAPATVAGSNEVVERIGCALEALSHVPEIAAAVGPVLHVLHVVLPEGPDYDVSYSDPEVPFSVFVGISPSRNESATVRLRLAEGILHEAMHLQLTLVEDVVPLVADSASHHYSPWQATMRPARGILHGIYVFAVIRDFMRVFEKHPRLGVIERRHASDRTELVTSELRQAAAPLLSGPGLTLTGRRLVEALVA